MKPFDVERRGRIALWLISGALACAPRPPSGEAAVPVASAEAASRTGEGEARSGAAAGALSTRVAGMMPQGVTTLGATVLGESVYVLGGYTGTPHAYNQRDQSRQFLRFDLKSLTWETLPSVGPIQSATLVNDGRYVYRVGGMRAMNEPGAAEDMRSLPDVARFDPKTGEWRALSNLPAPRSSHQAVLSGTRLYVIGGWSLAGAAYDSTWQDTLLSCDLSEPDCTWQTEPLPFSVRAMGAALHAGKIYVLGGLTPAGSTDAVHVYDLETRQWSLGPALPKDNVTAFAAVMNGALYANGADGRVYRLTAAGDAWEPVATLTFPRMFHQLVATREGLLALGGIPSRARGARVRHVERISDLPPTAGVVWTLDAQSSAKNRQGSFLLGGQLHVFGGNDSLEQHDFEPKNFVASAHRLDLGSLEWTALADFPAPRQSMQTLLAGTADAPTAYVIGGFGYDGERLGSQAQIVRYDFAAGKWTVLPGGLPEGRSQFGLTTWKDGAWIIGGLDFDKSRKDEEFRHPTSVLRLDLKKPEAGFVASGFELSQMRRAFAGGRLERRYYLTGGLAKDFASVTTCEVLDLETGTSSGMACPAAHRLGGELVPLADKLYLVGGSVQNAAGQREPTTRIEVYDPARDAWSTLTEKLPIDSPKQLSAYAFGEQLLLYSANRPTRSVQVALVNPKALAAGRTDFDTVTYSAAAAP